MIAHRNSVGQPCAGCPDSCTQHNHGIVVGGITIVNCCRMLYPHGTFQFSPLGELTREAYCCAGKNHDEELPSGCDAHAPNPDKGHIVIVYAPLGDKGFLEQRTAKLTNALLALSGRDTQGRPVGDRVINASLTAQPPTAAVRLYALEKRLNAFNGEEWHHVPPSPAEITKVRTALQ